MFVHWSDTNTSYRDMEKDELFCDRCQTNQLHTFRLYETKTKHYSAFSIGADYHVSVVCHGCLLESRVPKKEEDMLIRKYKNRIMCWEGFELIEKSKNDKAIKQFKKVLKEDPNHPQALYGLAKCLIATGEFSEAKMYVDELSVDYSESDEVKELKEAIVRNMP